MARRRGNNIAAAYIPVASNAGDLAAMANAYSAFGENVSGIGSGIKTGVADWAGHEEARVENYLDQFPDDISRRNALAELMNYEKQAEIEGGSQIGRFTDFNNVNEAVDAMQMRDMKVEERAEQALKSEDLHKEAVRALTQQKLMDPKLLTQQDATTDSLTTTTAKTQKDIDWFDRKIESAIGLEKETTAKTKSEVTQRSESDITTKIKEQTYQQDKKVIDDTKYVGEQLQKFATMPLTGEPNSEFGTITAQEENERLGLEHLSAVTRQIQDNNKKGIFDKHERLKKITRESLKRYDPGITPKQLKDAGVNEWFTPGSHDALRRILVDALATRYPTNTETELTAQANKMIDAHPDNLKTHFDWGKKLSEEPRDKREQRQHKMVVDKQIKQIHTAKKPEDRLKLISKHRQMNIRGAMSPTEMQRFNQFSAPFIEEFVDGINASDALFDNIPIGISSDPKFQSKLVNDVKEFGTARAIQNLDPRLFTPTLQRKMYTNIRKAITKQMGPMLKADLQPLVNMVMGENPAIIYQFGQAKKTVEFAEAMDDIRIDHEKELLKIDNTAIQGFKKNSTLVESIIGNIEKQATDDEIRDQINPRQLKFSVEKTAATIKRTLGVNSDWSAPNQAALNIAIGAFLSGVRINPNLAIGNDYTLPQISYSRDISKLSPNQLIEGLKEHLEFAASKVEDADKFDEIVSKYVENNPYKPSYVQMLLEKYSPIGQVLPGLYDGTDIEVFPFTSNSGRKKSSSQ
jgi:hypothetical protein